MSDFIAEIRPRTRMLPQFTTAHIPDGFVSEFRPRSHENTVPKTAQHTSDPLDVSDKELENILSGRSFSKEHMAHLLEGSVMTLIEKLLTGHDISDIEGQIRVTFKGESPLIVDLQKNFHKSSNSNYDYLTDVDGRLNIKVKDRDPHPHFLYSSSASYSENSPPHDYNRDDCPSIRSSPTKGSYSPTSSSIGYHSDLERSLSSPPHRSSVSSAPSPLPAPLIEVTPPVENSPQETGTESQRRTDSDEESGYTSNEKEDSDGAMEQTEEATNSDDATAARRHSPFNDYFCSGFDGKNTLYMPEICQSREPNCETTDIDSSGSSGEGSDEMDEDDNEDTDTPLVIDENPELAIGDENNNSTYIAPMEAHEELLLIGPADMRSEASIAGCGSLNDDGAGNVQSCAMEETETEDTDSPLSSDCTDTDGPVDLSGDSLLSSAISSVMPHPQSLVTKHPQGFKCKQCACVLPDAVAVSKHAQQKHDLFCCTHCCRTFTAKNNLKRHVRLHTGLRPYKCSQCSQSFARRDDLKGHMLRHDFSKPFRCSVCKKGYTDRACVKNHMAKEHRSRLMHVCPQCGESFDHDDAFTAHKKSHPELHQFSCKTCSFIGTNNLMTQKHGLLHSRKLFSCKPCNAYFADPFDYTNHVRKHKKSSSFCSYVCCFCDVELATYDQYVRHEYSHAQGKTHACKVCKKQFKSKSLLCDHARSHQTIGGEKARTESITVPDLDTDKPQARSVQQIQTTSVNFEPRPTEEPVTWTPSSENSLSPTSPVPWASQNDSDDYAGELLDLSMKKTPNPHSSGMFSDDHGQTGNFSTCQGPFGLTGKCVPRNGCVSESCGLRQEREAADRFSGAGRSFNAKDTEQTIPGPLFAVRDAHVTEDRDSAWRGRVAEPSANSPRSIGAMETGSVLLHPIPVYPSRPQSEERQTRDPNLHVSEHRRRSLVRSISGVHTSRTPLRASPYTRQKMADLAAKFVVARGPKVVGQKTPMTSVLPIGGAKDSALLRDRDMNQAKVLSQIPSLVNEFAGQGNLLRAMMDKESCSKDGVPVLTLRERHDNILNTARGVSGHCKQDNGQMSRENSNPETALRCHIPTLVKSEPMLENDMAAEMLPSRLFIDAKTEDLKNTIVGSGKGKTLACELCKEEFGSFSELEAHSVELHKRYLCEHCGKNFTARPNRDRHVRYHTGVRPYKCDLCDLAFFRGDDLKYHRTTRHPTAQPYVCPRCSASFTWGRDLERHIRHSKCKA